MTVHPHRSGFPCCQYQPCAPRRIEKCEHNGSQGVIPHFLSNTSFRHLCHFKDFLQTPLGRPCRLCTASQLSTVVVGSEYAWRIGYIDTSSPSCWFIGVAIRIAGACELIASTVHATVTKCANSCSVDIGVAITLVAAETSINHGSTSRRWRHRSLNCQS